MMKLRYALAMSVVVAVAATAQAGTYYKWTDTAGVVHYSQTPPLDQASKSVYVDDGTATAPLSPPQTPAEKEKAKATESALVTANAQAVTANCTAARQNVAKLESGKPVARPKNPGDVQVLDPQERTQALAEARTQATTYCASGK